MSGEKWFIQKLLEIDQRVTALSRGGVGIGKSSIASGESLTVATDTGEVVFKDGGLDYVSGEVPPVPSSATLAQDFGQLRVTWDGTFAADDVEAEEPVLVDAPLDLDVIEVHASTDPEEAEWGSDTMRSQIKTREGGTVPISGFDIDDEVFVVLIALSKTGLRSEPSTPTSIVIEGLNFDQLFNELDAATTIINNAREILIENEKTLGEKLDEVPDADGIASDIATARQEAIDAALAELDALEGTLTTKIDGKTTTQWSTSDPPASYTGAVGDTWIKLTSLGTGGREIARSKWNGTTWTVHKVDGASLSNVDASTITAGFLDVANRIRSGSIFADKVLIGSGGNLIPWDQILRGDSTDPIVMYQSDNGSVALAPPDSTLGVGRHIAWTRGETDNGSYGPIALSAPEDKRIPVEPNTTYTISARLYSTDLTSGVFIRAYQYSKESYYYVTGTSGPTVTLGPTPQNYSFQVTTNAKTNYLMPMVLTSGDLSTRRGTVHIADWSVKAAVDGTLITPGGVQTPHLAADVLEVGNLKAGTAAIAEAVVKKLFAEVVVAEMVTATEFIGENAILTGAVTAPKLTVTEEMWAKFGEFVKIRAGQIEADAIDGMVITGPNIRTAASGARVQMDTNGLRVINDDDEPTVKLPSDGTAATFNGELVAKSLTATGRASFLADNNRLEPGAGLVLASGVGDPPSPPIVAQYYKQVTPPALVDRESVSGLAYGDGLFWRAVDAGAGNNDQDRIEGIDRGGVIQRTIPLVNFWARNGLTVIGDELFALGIRDDRPENVRSRERWVRVYGLDGTYKRQWEYPNYGTGTYQPGIGSTPAGNVSIAQCWVDGKLSWRTFSPTGSLVNTTTRDAPVKSDAVGIYGGPADFGATRTVFAKGFTPGTNRQFTVYGSNGNDYFPEQSWYSPGRGDVRGLAWDGEKFYSIDTEGIITEYEALNMGDDSANWWATYRWVGSGGKTTRIAPPARFAWARRSRLRVSAPNLPQGVTTIEPSLAFKTSTPARTDFHSPEWVSGPSNRSVDYLALPDFWYSEPSPGDTNNFPNSTPASVKASTGLFEARGDGSGRWGPIVWEPDGTVHGATAAGEVIVPINAANANRTLAVTFESGRFKTPPTVVATPVTPDPQTVQVSVSNITATGFTVVARRTVAANAYVKWVATEG